MSAVNIYEVRQRETSNPLVSRSLGYFTDSGLAEQVIWAAYREAWKVLASKDFEPSDWFPLELRDHVVKVGMDRWSVDDYNSGAPMFYVEKHKMWNQVPSSFNNFTLTMEGSVAAI